LLGARLREIAEMTRDELSVDGTTWSLPGRRSKNGKPNKILLPALARELQATREIHTNAHSRC